MSRVSVTIDGKKIECQNGERLLWVALGAGIYIPNLCSMKGVEPRSACRLCWVEVEGVKEPQTSCTVVAEDGLVAKTSTKAIDRLVRSSFDMLLSTHRLNCKHCPGNNRCSLQNIAKKRKIPLGTKRFPKIDFDYPIDDSRPDMGFDPNHCILCGRCVYVCNHELDKGILDFSQRGLYTVVSTFDGEPLVKHDCDGCTRCAEVCPVKALYLKK